MYRLFALAFLLTPALAQTPVMIGGSENVDACPSQGIVTGLNPKGDGFLSVRADPSSKGKELARLKNNDPVFLCEKRGEWHGIVYGKDDCQISSPLLKKQPYKGTCRSGWVHQKFVKLLAG